jgi:uncharacterized coiled-coil DUF342 family protein
MSLDEERKEALAEISKVSAEAEDARKRFRELAAQALAAYDRIQGLVEQSHTTAQATAWNKELDLWRQRTDEASAELDALHARLRDLNSDAKILCE